MNTIVQKYGGSSVSTPGKLRDVARRIVETRERGYRVVVVVSAMGNTTNQLLSLAKEVSPQPQRRELDMLLTVGERISMSLLSMAIQDLGAPAVSFTGSQSGIITTDTHTNARITEVRPKRVLKALDDDFIVIIAGFQGVSEELEITSLGRGGSDTTAVAMAAALDAEFVEICSDVDGIYSTDPRIDTEAYKVDELSYEEMQDLADSGAKVLNAEAIEWARRSGIEVRCVATADPHRRGTVIKKSRERDRSTYHHRQLSAITAHPGLLRIEGSEIEPSALSECLHRFGVTDADIYWSTLRASSTRFWTCWVPTQNLHQREHFLKALHDLGAHKVEDEWSWVTLVGRSLLGTDATMKRGHESQETMLEREAQVSEEGSSLINEIRTFYLDQHMNAEELYFTPHSLRWAIPLSEAASLVRALHSRYLTASTSTSPPIDQEIQ